MADGGGNPGGTGGDSGKSVIDAPAGGGAAPGGGSWADAFDPDTKGWIGGMGLDKLPPDQALAKVLPMYRGAEQKLGVPADQLIRLPKGDDDAEGWNAVLAKLGRPEKPEDYGLPVPEGQKDDFAKAAAGWFHEIGIPKRMAAGLAAKWNEHVAGQVKAETDSWNQRFDQEIAALQGEWKGEEYAKNTDLAQRVMRAAGWEPEQLKLMEKVLGPAALLKGFAKFGQMVGEAKFVGGEGQQGGGFGMTPAAATERIEALKKDATWMAAYLSGDADKVAEWTKLHKAAFGDGLANPSL